MESALFDYHLPKASIAQQPTEQRDAARLMVVDRSNRQVTHAHFSDIAQYLPANARYFRNNAAVIKARLFGKRPSGGRVECLLLNPAEDALTWWCLLKPGKKTMAGQYFGLEGDYTAKVLEVGQQAAYRVRFDLQQDPTVTALAERLGRLPLPPYIQHTDAQLQKIEASARYQTVYADYQKQIAVAAPTAGLHFTPELIESLKNRGADFYDLTLRIGIGTFHPIQVEQLEEHAMHKEWYELSKEVLDQLQTPSTGPRVAVGTTAVRTIEDVLARVATDAEIYAGLSLIQQEADLFIYPPAQFRGVDALITNFHLPKSTLLCLVASFLAPGSQDGIQWLQELYAEAIDLKYRFYSYGDAMLIL
ncbi:MAG: tRNA preQ1(34) S-adenosylmethionine ribosyltransferase-isomerase QueA [Opitutales bacterium]